MSVSKQFYKGETRDFIVFIDSHEKAEQYLKDSTVPLSSVVSVFKIFTSGSGRGSEGVIEEASKQELETEFGKKSIEEIVEIIVRQGENKSNPDVNRKGWRSTNDSNGPAAHY